MYVTHSHSDFSNPFRRGGRRAPCPTRRERGASRDGQSPSDWLSWRRFPLDHPHA
ncbi:hypothetical protein SZ55_3789 [Pseudomonas sp. FeS53a]|nr:hypothetical protein SZ55_3789 [Pseudomonas sp. FeS53a]